MKTRTTAVIVLVLFLLGLWFLMVAVALLLMGDYLASIAATVIAYTFKGYAKDFAEIVYEDGR